MSRQLVVPKAFEIGKDYTNDQICYALEVPNLGGIRPRLTEEGLLDFIVVITSVEENRAKLRNPYSDRIEGNILTFTGAGLKGEQKISGVNKRLLEQIQNPVPILGFVKEAVNKYKFIGFLYLLRHYKDYQLDNEEVMRPVLVFEFQILQEIGDAFVGKFSTTFTSEYNRLKNEITIDDTKIDEPVTFNSEEVSQTLRDIEILKTKFMTFDPYQFENVVGDLISHVGFSEVQVTKKSGDEGIDVRATLRNLISTDLQFMFQVKRWKHSVGRNEVANLRGSMGLNNQGVIIATSHFTTSAIKESCSQNKTPINLVGMNELYTIIKVSNFQMKSEY